MMIKTTMMMKLFANAMTDEKSNLSIYDPFIVNIVLLNREG